jgi:DNA-binding PadR family transcriptional regulator
LEVLRFLNLFRRDAKNIYQIYHSDRRFDIKKVYRYLRYCANINLIEIDHIAEKGFLPAKYYRLTEKGRALIELFKASREGGPLE